MTYSEKLKDPKWQKKRLQILKRDNWTCQCCGDTKSTLHVHHSKYNGEPWDYVDTNFITLCVKCHESEELFKIQANDLIHDLLLMGNSYEAIYLELKKLVK